MGRMWVWGGCGSGEDGCVTVEALSVIFSEESGPTHTAGEAAAC